MDPLGVLRPDRDAAARAQVVFITPQRVVRGVRAAFRKRWRWGCSTEEFVVEYESGIGYIYGAAVVGIGCIHAYRARTSHEQIIHNEVSVDLIDLIVLVGVPTDKLLVGR